MQRFLISTLSLFSMIFSQELFEPGLISTETASEYGLTFIDDNSIAFSRQGSDRQKKIYLCKRLNGKWQTPQIASFSGMHNDEYPSFDPVSKRLYFSSQRPVDGIEQSRNDIWYVVLQNDKSWSEPQHLSGQFSGPGIESGTSSNGDLIYFHSDRSGSGMNSVDIYSLSFKEPNSTAMKLKISTDQVDGEPHIFNNGMAMLFMSAGHNAIGASDIFLSELSRNNWSTPVALSKINSKDWDYSPTLSPDLKQLYFTRLSRGPSNIYVINTDQIPELKNLLH
ncbi:MAG: PD40 domain-containing protein [Calditrichaeota bacterium]|nr:PD40 domain-containing protein [Calditrichota bacterium]